MPELSSANPSLTTYSEVIRRPRFDPDLDKTAHTPKEIIAEYHEETDEVPCGLKGCHEPHKHGIHFVCVDGTESNMGWDCAERDFPDHFDRLKRSFKERRTYYTNLAVLDSYRVRRDEHMEEIDDLWRKERGAWWADQCARIYRDQCPQFVVGRLFVMAKDGDWKIRKIRELDRDDENALSLGYRADDRIERTQIGEIQGGEALLLSARDILKDLRDRMHEFDAVTDPSKMSARQRVQWSNWINSIDEKLRTTRDQIDAARVFYTRKNLQELLKIARDDDERRKVRAFIAAVERCPTQKLRRAG